MRRKSAFVSTRPSMRLRASRSFFIPTRCEPTSRPSGMMMTSRDDAAAMTDAAPPRPKKRDVSGWVVLDKSLGVTSTHAVAQVKRLYRAKKAGHAGTLDPLASGILPIALGEATKTVPFVMD